MKNYPINKVSTATHTIRITFQLDDYRGCAYYKIGGNLKGWQVMGTSDLLEELAEAASTNNLILENMRLRIVDQYFEIELTNDAGEICRLADQLNSLEELMVAIEIVDYKSEVGKE